MGKLLKSPFLNENKILIVKNEVGYDGQQFLSLAFDTLMNHEGTLEALDNPRYRAKRILLPLVSNFLSLGEYKLIPYLFVVLNSIGILAIFYLFYSIHKNKLNYYFLTLAIPGIWIVLRISTAEIIANTLILTSYFFIQHKKDKTSFLFLFNVLGASSLFVDTWTSQKAFIAFLSGSAVIILNPAS